MPHPVTIKTIKIDEIRDYVDREVIIRGWLYNKTGKG